jgi:hypothetical protein
VIEDRLYSMGQSLLLAGDHSPDVGAGSRTARHAPCMRAESTVRDDWFAPLTVGGLCQRIGTSERVLDLAFRDLCGVSLRPLLTAFGLHAHVGCSPKSLVSGTSAASNTATG